MRIDTRMDSCYSSGMNTKYIARITGLPVAHINAAARDLDIATYDAACRCWRVEDRYAAAFIAHLVEVSE